MAAHSSPLTPSTPLGHVVGAAASGVATALFAPSRIPAPVRRSVHVGLGVASGAGMAWALGRPDPEPSGQQAGPLPLQARLAVGTALGSLVAASSVAGMWLDSAVERALVRRGVRHPRVWIGVAAAGLTLATSWAEARFDTGSDAVPEPPA